jgi:hypothetical protein
VQHEDKLPLLYKRIDVGQEQHWRVHGTVNFAEITAPPPVCGAAIEICHNESSMSRTPEETEFARMLGRTGELLAPRLLARIGMTDVRDLNQDHTNHPWADFAGRLNDDWALVAVRTRLNWVKPRRIGVALTSYGFNGAGARKAKLAADMFRLSNDMEKDERIRHLWLAIAVDLDNTYEAYWGDVSEMRVIPRQTGDHGYRIRMAPEDRARYTSEGRRLACHEPIEIQWDDFPGEWAYTARQAYLSLESITDRDRRIEEAVKMHLGSADTNLSKVAECSEEITTLSGELSTAASEATAEQNGRNSATLERALSKCTNPAIAAFVQQRLGDTSQGRMKRALSYSCLGHNGSRTVVGWYLTLFDRHARVRQLGRFSGDEQFWRICVSNPDSVHPLDGGNHLCFNLSTAGDCRVFQAIMQDVGSRIRME